MMACYDELTLSELADGELPPAQVPEVEAHLAECAACRSLREALEGEVRSLKQALCEVAPEAQPLARGGAAWWLAGIAAALVGLATGVDLLLNPPVPSELSWLDPTSLGFTLSLLLDGTMFVIKEGVPTMPTTLMLVLTALTLTTLALRKAGPRLVGIAAGLALACASSAGATETRFPEPGSQRVVIPAGETIDDTLVTAADSVLVEGTVKGDLLAMGRDVRVQGTVTGSLMCVSRHLEIEGRIDGDVYALDENLTLRGQVGRSIHSLAKRTNTDVGSRVERDLLVMAEETRVAGSIGRDERSYGRLTELAGQIGRDAHVTGERLYVLASARVAGDLMAKVAGRKNLEVSPGAKIQGATRFDEGDSPSTKAWAVHGPRYLRSRFANPRFYLWQTLWLAAALLTGAVLFWLAPAAFQPRALSGVAALRTIGLGFLALVVLPIAALVVGLTLVGLPIALMVAGGWVAALYLAGVFVATWVGQLLLRRPTPDLRTFLLALLLGELLLRVATHVPFVGGVVGLFTLILGLGLVSTALVSSWRRWAAA